MSERNYSHRAVVDKLVIKTGHTVMVDENCAPLDAALRAQILERIGRPLAEAGEPLDVVIVTLQAGIDPEALLRRWKDRIRPAGGIWLLTAKRGMPGYIDQRELIDAGPRAGLVDNKVCAVSSSVSAMRFVIRVRDRTRI